MAQKGAESFVQKQKVQMNNALSNKKLQTETCGSTSQSSFVFFMIHKTKHITISYVHTTSSLLKFKNQEQKNG